MIIETSVVATRASSEVSEPAHQPHRPRLGGGRGSLVLGRGPVPKLRVWGKSPRRFHTRKTSTSATTRTRQNPRYSRTPSGLWFQGLFP